MDTSEIAFFLNKIHCEFKNNVFPANRLPIKVTLPMYLISNLDPDTKPGSHWVAIYISSNGIGEYFDSFGRKPTTFHENFLKRNSKLYFHNGTILQNHLTTVCGMYCLMYIYCKFNKVSMYNYINMFTNDTLYNDLFLRQLFKDVFSY